MNFALKTVNIKDCMPTFYTNNVATKVMKKCGTDVTVPFTAVSTYANGISRISDNVPFLSFGPLPVA